MNPRSGQFALGGTVHGWTEIDVPSSRQARLLRRCYRGHEPRTFSRYGRKQWTAVLPWATTIVKDPFALLSVPAIVRTTGAVPIVVYRHPGAVLASYRRMGWTANVEEIRLLQSWAPGPAPLDDVAAMIELWNFLHGRVLTWLPLVPDAVLVSHAELSLGGAAALDVVRRRCGLRPLAGSRAAVSAGKAAGPGTPAVAELHRFQRRADEVANGWRTRLREEELARLEQETAGTWDALQSRRLTLT